MNCGCQFSSGKHIVGLPKQLKPRFLSGLPNSDLSSLLSSAKHRIFRTSSVIVHEGDPADRVFLLTSGHGRQFVVTKEGRKILLHWLTAGQIFGGTAILSAPTHYLASTELFPDSCAWVWERQTMRESMFRCPQLVDNALSIAVMEHLAWAAAAMVSLSSDDARGRIAHLLVSLACGVGHPTSEGVELRIRNEDLAAGANVTPFTASRAMREWQRAGVLTKARGKVLLKKPELLFDYDKNHLHPLHVRVRKSS